jgi:hypothetical protein
LSATTCSATRPRSTVCCATARRRAREARCWRWWTSLAAQDEPSERKWLSSRAGGSQGRRHHRLSQGVLSYCSVRSDTLH